jgi:hypothetical protein
MSIKTQAFAFLTTCSILAASMLPSVTQASQANKSINKQHSFITQDQLGPQSLQRQLDLSKLKIKLVNKNKDGSETYTVNGKKITVTKKQIQAIQKEFLKSQPNTGVTVQALPYFGSVAAMIVAMQGAVGAYSYQAAMFFSSICFVRPDNCAKTLMSAWNGSVYAKDQLVRWSRGKN